MIGLILKPVSFALLLVGLAACQTTAIPESCIVSAQDIETAQSRFRSSFKDVMKGKEPSKPRLSSVFVKPVTITSVKNSNKNTLNYKWDIKITEGCTLTANLGTNASDIQGPDYSVSRLAFKASAKDGSKPYYDPISITLNK